MDSSDRLVKGFAFEFKIPTQVQSAYFGVIGHGFGGSLAEDFAFKQQSSLVGDGQGFLNVVVGDEDSNVTAFEGEYNLLNVLHCNGVDACKGLVQ